MADRLGSCAWTDVGFSRELLDRQVAPVEQPEHLVVRGGGEVGFGGDGLGRGRAEHGVALFLQCGFVVGVEARQATSQDDVGGAVAGDLVGDGGDPHVGRGRLRCR